MNVAERRTELERSGKRVEGGGYVRRGRKMKWRGEKN